jgi:hypothetical protein
MQALVAFMTDAGVFPKQAKPSEALDFYLQACSIEVDTSIAATIAGTLANGGVCPLTGVAALSPVTVKSTISLMFSCGMYDYSGTWMSEVGLPAKSGVAGLIYVVVPHVMGIAVFAPPLDSHGNSVRGVEFCKRLLQHYPFGIFDQIVAGQRLAAVGVPSAPTAVAKKQSFNHDKQSGKVKVDTRSNGTRTASPMLGAMDEEEVGSVLSGLQLGGGASVYSASTHATKTTKASSKAVRSVDHRSSAQRMDAWLSIARRIRRAHRAIRKIRVWCGLPVSHEDLVRLQQAALLDPEAPAELLPGGARKFGGDTDRDVDLPLSYQLYKEYRATVLQSRGGWGFEDAFDAALEKLSNTPTSTYSVINALQQHIQPSESLVPIDALALFIEAQGISIQKDNPHVHGLWSRVRGGASPMADHRCVSLRDVLLPGEHDNTLVKAITGSLSMPNFPNFVNDITALFETVSLSQ